MRPVPDHFARRILEIHGAAGAEWLRQLPSVIAECADRWSLRLLPPFEPLSYHYVAPAVRSDGIDVVLKLGVPDRELQAEAAALRAFDGHGVARLLDADPARGILLLERLKPGTPLSSLADDQRATSIAVEVMLQMWRPVPSHHQFPTIAEWASGLKKMRERLNGGCAPFPADLVEAAEGLFAELIGSMSEPVLLHGDLHHDNILAAQREPWLALDPKGLVGEAAYEVGALLRNPLPQLLAQPHPERRLARRVDQLARELGFDRARLVGWALAQAVLAAWWSYEDHGRGWEPWIACAQLLSEVRRSVA